MYKTPEFIHEDQVQVTNLLRKCETKEQLDEVFIVSDIGDWETKINLLNMAMGVEESSDLTLNEEGYQYNCDIFLDGAWEGFLPAYLFPKGYPYRPGELQAMVEKALTYDPKIVKEDIDFDWDKVEVTLAPNESLKRLWNTPEEDEAWKCLDDPNNTVKEGPDLGEQTKSEEKRIKIQRGEE